MSGSGREALLDVQVRSGGPPGCPGWSGGSPECPGVVGRPYWMSRSGGEALPDIHSGLETLPDVREWSDAPRMSGSGRIALPNVRDSTPGCPRCSPGCPGVVGRHSRISGSGVRYPGCPGLLVDVREALSDVREWSVDPFQCPGGPPGYPGVVGWPSRMSGSGWNVLPDVREALPVVREWSGDPSECSGVVGGPPGCPGGLADVREWLGGPPGSSGGLPNVRE